MLKKREQIEEKFKWDLEKMFTSESWVATADEVEKKSNAFVENYQGKIMDSPENLLKALDDMAYLRMKVESLYAFAQMKKDEDNNVSESLERYAKAVKLISVADANTSFFKPEILSKGIETALEYINKNDELKKYEFLITEIFRKESHTLSKEEEKIISTLGEVLGSGDHIFTMLSYTDLQFDDVIGKDGEKIPLTYGSYGTLISSSDREIRKQAYQNLYAAIRKNKNTLAATLLSSVKTDVILSNIRKFDTALDMYLFDDNIPNTVYHNLLEVMDESLPLLHRYLKLRKKLLGLDKLHFYDLYVPMVNFEEGDYEYEEAVKMVKESLKPLGEEYCNYASNGFDSRWIDVYENEGKSGGAYSYGSYESMPYILLNYNGSMQNIFTITHEMGHSMHSLYARKTQPFIYSGYSLFTAEVASTVNEGLLANYLIKNAEDKAKKLYLINTYLEGFRQTIFRQAMFAEFELLTHTTVEKGDTLTTEFLCEKYLELNNKYFGGLVELDDDIALEWARIPHFYSAYYVYKYATGYSAATAITGKILNEGEKAVDKYIDFLKSGGSNHPIEVLKISGVDMSTTEPIKAAMKKFESLLDEMEELIR